ncbi:hypothetical protein VTN77DRAFT_4594 [Rasamsonia byssochlamydoides]|uniref:uncharacterized protein n=1 Tax=Rasamsonia byssochlamydoides TaxID=89139 RepID=UPI003743D261
MGAKSSKPVRSAVSAASRRQYPKTPSPSTTMASPESRAPAEAQPRHAGPTYHSKEQASATKSEAIDLDARDPHFAASLRSIGPVIPNPTMSNSSTFNKQGPVPSVFPDAANPALLVLASRAKITKAAEEEAESFGRQSHEGRQFLDVLTIRQALSMRDKQGLPDGEIERLLRLKKGVVARLGRKGLVGEVG